MVSGDAYCIEFLCRPIIFGFSYKSNHVRSVATIRSIVNTLLCAGANIYAKSDGDILPVQLATDQATLDFLSTRMKSDMEDRISPKQAKFASNFPRSPTNDQAQAQALWTETALLANNKPTGFCEARSPDRIVGESINKNAAAEYQDREILGASTQSGFSAVAGQAAGSRLMDWEALRNMSSEIPNQNFVHRGFDTQSSNTVPNEFSNSGISQSMDVWMQDGAGRSQGSLTRPSFEVVQEKYGSALCFSFHIINFFVLRKRCG